MTHFLFSPPELKRFLAERGLRLTKKFGQNFLTDRNKTLQILSLLEPGRNDTFVEIGAGIGTMTLLLAARVRSVTAFEIDRGLVRVLTELASETPGISIVPGDFLKTGLPEHFPSGVKVYSSLPYNSAMRILIRLAGWADRIERLVVLLPEEIVTRIRAVPGRKEYGVPAIFFDTYFRLENAETRVENRLFFPSPQGHSRAVLLFPQPRPDNPDPEAFMAFVSRFFQNRRKMLKKSLPSGAEALLAPCGLTPADRPENAPPEFYRRCFSFKA